MSKQVITWESPRGNLIDICPACEKRLAGRWPKDGAGEEYCRVYHGLHAGECEMCHAHEREAYEWAKKEQGFTGTWADWLALSVSARAEYEAGAAGLGN